MAPSQLRSCLLRTFFCITVMAGLAVPFCTCAQGSTLPLEPGRWELSLNVRGAPIADPPPRSVCLSAQELSPQPERALLDAALRSLPGGPAAGPQCALSDFKRDAAQSSWQARCNGPRGPVQGAGTGVLAAQTATLQQTFEVDTPLGPQTLKQTIRARRTGACA
jgi:hypothetical protein